MVRCLHEDREFYVFRSLVKKVREMPARNGSVGSRSDLYTDQIAFIFCNGDTDWTLDDEISTDDQTLRIFKQRQLIPTYSAAKIFLLLDSFEMSDRQKAVVE